MIKHYVITALRNIRKQKGYSFINFAGLAVGMACCLLIVLYIQDELSYDTFHDNADRIFRVVTSTSQDGSPTNANGTFGTGPALKEDFPEIEEYVRLRKMGQGTRIFVGHGERKFYEERFYFADPSIFTVFSFPLLRGNPAEALSEPGSIVITEAMAEKYFGRSDPVGLTLETDPYNSGEKKNFQVTAIAKNVPRNSHFHFDFLASYADQNEDLTTLGGLSSHYTYILLQDASQATQLDAQLPDFINRHVGANSWYTNRLQPLQTIRLRSRLRSEIEPTGNMASITIFSLVAVFVLIIACINYINLSTARSLQRTKEVGMRKVIGARKKQLLAQFLGESLLVCFISGLLALLLAALFLPVFNALTDKGVALRLFTDLLPVVFLIGTAAVVGILSGSYIAFWISGLTPIQVFKGISSFKKGNRKLKEGLVVFQFILATILIFGALTAQKQMSFVQNQNTGYNRDEILVIPLNREARAAYAALRNDLLTSPFIRNTATSSNVPTRGSYHESVSFEGLEQNITPVLYYVDKEFIDTYGIEILEGANFSLSSPKLSDAELLISLQTVSEAGYSSPEDSLGKQVQWSSRGVDFSGQICGVIPDMNLYSFRRHVFPMLLLETPVELHEYLSIRFDADHSLQAVSAVQSSWKRHVPGYPLDYFFLDSSFEALHRADKKMGDLLQVFSITAVVVACLGLFGLAAYTAEQKTKEIGIRKVLGATELNIYFLLSKDFLVWVAAAMVIAWPLAYYSLHKWLEGFVYRIRIGWDVFLISGGLALIISVFTISLQFLKSARANPVDSLRYE